MELSSKGRYAVMALIDLAKHGGGENSVALNDIAIRQKISLSYLEQLFAKMRKRGVVVARRGPNGGYKLARSATQIDIASVVLAVDESIKATACDLHSIKGCGTRDAKCIAHDLWAALTRHIHDFMANVTLADVIENKIIIGGKNDK